MYKIKFCIIFDFFSELLLHFLLVGVLCNESSRHMVVICNRCYKYREAFNVQNKFQSFKVKTYINLQFSAY